MLFTLLKDIITINTLRTSVVPFRGVVYIVNTVGNTKGHVQYLFLTIIKFKFSELF